VAESVLDWTVIFGVVKRDNLGVSFPKHGSDANVNVDSIFSDSIKTFFSWANYGLLIANKTGYRGCVINCKRMLPSVKFLIGLSIPLMVFLLIYHDHLHDVRYWIFDRARLRGGNGLFLALWYWVTHWYHMASKAFILAHLSALWVWRRDRLIFAVVLYSFIVFTLSCVGQVFNNYCRLMMFMPIIVGLIWEKL
jgi:hypothetical protein